MKPKQNRFLDRRPAPADDTPGGVPAADVEGAVETAGGRPTAVTVFGERLEVDPAHDTVEWRGRTYRLVTLAGRASLVPADRRG